MGIIVINKQSTGSSPATTQFLIMGETSTIRRRVAMSDYKTINKSSTRTIGMLDGSFLDNPSKISAWSLSLKYLF